MSEITKIKACETNLKNKLAYIPKHIDNMTVQSITDVLLVDSYLPSDTFNVCFGGTINESNSEAVAEYFNDCKRPMAWWVGPSSQQLDTNAFLERAGFAHDEQDVGMYCELSKQDDITIPETGLVIKQCHSPEEIIDFGKVLASIFDPVDEYVETFYQLLSQLPPEEYQNLKLFVGYEAGKPVASASLFLTDVAGIYDIATRPDKRKKGYGTALFATAMHAAKQLGFDNSILQASPDGLGIYQRYGYQSICEFNVWSNQALLEQVSK